MEETYPQRKLIERVLADSANHDAFQFWLHRKLDTTLSLQPTADDFFTKSAFLLEKESRIKAIKEIMAEFRAMHESANADNPYNLNQTS